ncbi:TPA: MHS family MFS transporter, partial [Corynebacterium striatum]|nr:MHS family MFS transporter [Corynebacterium striatum]
MTGPTAPLDTQSSAPEQVEVNSKDVFKIASSAFIGTALEWYDFFL